MRKIFNLINIALLCLFLMYKNSFSLLHLACLFLHFNLYCMETTYYAATLIETKMFLRKYSSISQILFQKVLFKVTHK